MKSGSEGLAEWGQAHSPTVNDAVSSILLSLMPSGKELNSLAENFIQGLIGVI